MLIILFFNLLWGATKSEIFIDQYQVRYTLVKKIENSSYNFILIPGGPGLDSSCFIPLVKLVNFPGNVYLMDMPGNGSNKASRNYNYDLWLKIFVPSLKQFKNPIVVAHSAGAMFPLLFTKLESILKGFIILNSAPCLWLKESAKYALNFNLPDLSKAMKAFVVKPCEETFKKALDACMPYYFEAKSLVKGGQIVKSVPLNYRPVVWFQKKIVEINYKAKWVPQKVPTLIVSAQFDCITPPYMFDKDHRFKRANIKREHIKGAGHFPWIEKPDEVKSAIESFLFYAV